MKYYKGQKLISRYGTKYIVLDVNEEQYTVNMKSDDGRMYEGIFYGTLTGCEIKPLSSIRFV